MHETELQDCQTKLARFQHQIDSHALATAQLEQQHEEQVSTLNAEVENYKAQILQWSEAYNESAQQLMEMTEQNVQAQEENEHLH